MSVSTITNSDYLSGIWNTLSGKIAEINSVLSRNATITVGSSTSASLYDYQCDGVADEVEIMAALAAANAAGGGAVILSNGVFNTSHPIFSNYNGVSLRAANDGMATIKPAVGWTVSSPTGSGSTGAGGVVTFGGVTRGGMRGIIVNTTNLAASLTVGVGCNGIEMIPNDTNVPCKNMLIEFNQIISNRTPQYQIWNLQGQNNTIRHNKIDGGWTTTLATTTDAATIAAGNVPDQNGIELYGAVNCLVYGNEINNVSGCPILLQAIAGSLALPTHLLGNHIFDNWGDLLGDGFRLNGGASTANGNIANNCIGNFVVNNNFTRIYRYGLYFIVSTDATNSTNYSELSGNEIRGNRFTAATAAEGAYTDCKSLYCDNATGNIAKATFAENLISGNKFYNFAPSAVAGGGIARLHFWGGTKLVNNFNITPPALFIAGAGNTCVNLYMQGCNGIQSIGCTWSGSYRQGVRLGSCTSIDFIDNEVLNFNTDPAGNGWTAFYGTGNSKISICGTRMESGVVGGISKLIDLTDCNGLTMLNNEYRGNGYTGDIYGSIAMTVVAGTADGSASNATNCNRGRLTATAGTITVNTDRCRAHTVPDIVQRTGVATALGLEVASNGSFTFTAVAGDYDWSLVN